MLDFISLPNPFYLLGAGITYYLVNFAFFHTYLRSWWIDWTHFSEKDLEDNEAKDRPFKTAAIAVSVFLTTIVLWSLLNFFQVGCWCGAVTVAFYLWLGFTATNLLNTFLWEPTKYYVLLYNWGYRLASLTSQALVLNWMREHEW
jgi:Protein of unknown function (DUF1761)